LIVCKVLEFKKEVSQGGRRRERAGRVAVRKEGFQLGEVLEKKDVIEISPCCNIEVFLKENKIKKRVEMERKE
jgi:hypothetical protein